MSANPGRIDRYQPLNTDQEKRKMKAQLAVLYKLQEIDLGIAKAQKTRAALDDGTAKKKEIAAAQGREKEAETRLHESTAEQKDNELNLKSVEEKRKVYKDKLYKGGIMSPKELENIEKEIDMLTRQKGKLEEKILELYDVVEQRKTDYAENKTAREKNESELSEILSKLKTDQDTLAKKIADLASQREVVVLEVDPILLKRYEASRARFGGVVISRVNDNDCSACHTEITGFIIRELKSDSELITCENCGRILLME